jgi:hypothetical protein
MIILVPTDYRIRFRYYISCSDLKIEFQNINIDENYMTWVSYSLPNATVDDALVLKLKFPNCKIQHFAL